MFRPGLNAGSHPPVRVAPNKLVSVRLREGQSMERREGGVQCTGRPLPTSKATAVVINWVL